MLKHDTGSSLPPHDDKFQLANDMGNFFVKKVTNIRKELDDAASGACCDPAEYDFPRSVVKSFHEFTPLSDEDVIALVRRSSKKCLLSNESSNSIWRFWQSSGVVCILPA